MNYDAELRFLCDTLHRLGLQTAIADLSRPVSRLFTAGIPPMLPDHIDESRPLADHLPSLSPATVYNLSGWLQCCYICFLLPQLQPEAILLIGPYLTEPMSTERIMELSEQYGVDTREHKRVERYYASLPTLPKNSHIHLLLDTFFDRIWGPGNYTAETIRFDHVQDTPAVWPGLRLSEEENILVDMAIMEERYAQENGLIDAVRQGKIWRVESIMSRITPAAFERRVADPVRNLKNYCIITNTLLRKAAEQGGVHPVYIDSLSSSFALRIEQITSAATGPLIIEEMARAYCRLVRNHATKGYSAPVQKAILMIESDLSANLSLSQLARQVNVNSSYLSALFKKETGSTVTDYTTGRRISHARHLLENTRLQIQTVGQLCGFEDVHYFSKIFKKLTGQTPKQYRQSVTVK